MQDRFNLRHGNEAVGIIIPLKGYLLFKNSFPLAKSLQTAIRFCLICPAFLEMCNFFFFCSFLPFLFNIH